MKIRVALNGTDVNPYARLGLTQNLIPQTARVEWDAACLRLQSLGGEPIPHDDPAKYIKQKLRGISPQLVDVCIKNFKPGVYLSFDIIFPDN